MAMVCPTDETLGAMIGKNLDADEVLRIGAHLDTCPQCQEIVVAAVRAAGTPPDVPVTAAAGPAPERIGRYVVRGLLGAGGMGRVYEAYDAELDRTIALKVLRPELATRAPMLAERLVRESRLMAKVSHPAVIAVHDVGRTGDAVFIAMELIRGETLAAYIARVQPGWREILGVFVRAGAGLAAAHEAGIVHRDFKPDNVLVETTRDAVTRVVVTDFGIAYATALVDDMATPVGGGALPVDLKLTATGAALGTPAYMAPEQLAADRVDRRADVFAFSVSLWEALYGARPFPGRTIEDIRRAMEQPPRAPRSPVPRRAQRVLLRGLAIAPGERWPDVPAMLAALVAVTSVRRRVLRGVTAVGLVGLGISAAVLARPAAADPCEVGGHGFPRAVLTSSIVDPATRGVLDARIASWHETQRGTCSADRAPVRSPAAATCLAARAIEIDGVVDDTLADGPALGAKLVGLIGDPARCAEPAPSMLVASIPDDPAVRRRVTRVREQVFEIEALRDHTRYADAIARSRTLLAVNRGIWPRLDAELVFTLASIETLGGSNANAHALMREAAALAERTHHDSLAANAWTQLIYPTAFDDADVARALEYATYADAALERCGRPSDLETSYLYAKGTAELEAAIPDKAETDLRAALELARAHEPSYLAMTSFGLATVVEDAGRFPEAIALYRDALAHLGTDPSRQTSAYVYRERLAASLSTLGRHDEAITESRAAVAIADQTLGAQNLDRWRSHVQLGEVLESAGQFEDALAEVRTGAHGYAASAGEHGASYASILVTEADVLLGLTRYGEAAKVLARACTELDDGNAAHGLDLAGCFGQQSLALEALHQTRDALPIADRAIAIYRRSRGDDYAETLTTRVLRGSLLEELGRYDEGITEVSGALATLRTMQIDPGYVGAAAWALGKLEWKRDRTRARILIAEAIVLFGTASGAWSELQGEAVAWLAAGGRR